MARALELKVAIPDPLILMQVLGKMSDAVGKLGGAQVSYRLASVRQELQVDPRPLLPAVQEYAEFLQAEAEDLSLMTSGPKAPTTTTTSSAGAAVTAAVKAVALSGGGADDKPRGACRFWGTSGGCRRGDFCTYLHSWDGINKENRCFGCSGAGHMKKDCPHKKDGGSSGWKQKVAKVKDKGRDAGERNRCSWVCGEAGRCSTKNGIGEVFSG